MRIVREVPRDSTYYAARSRIVRVLFSKSLRAYSRGRYLLVAHLKYQGFKKEAQKKRHLASLTNLGQILAHWGGRLYQKSCEGITWSPHNI